MVDVLTDGTTERANAVVWKSPAREPVRGPATVLDRQPPKEFVLERSKGRTDLPGSRQGGVAREAGEICLSGRVGASVALTRKAIPQSSTVFQF
jgi:hypothetical protein